MVSETHDSLDIIVVITNVYEIEGVISNRVIYTFLTDPSLSSPRQRTKTNKTDVPFIDEISGLVIIKLLDLKLVVLILIKKKLIINTRFLDVT